MGAIALGIGGLVAGVAGSQLSSEGQRRAMNQNRDLGIYQGQYNQGGLGRLLYGDQYQLMQEPGNSKLSYGVAPGSPSSGSILGRMGGLAQYAEGQNNNILSGYNAGTGRLMNLANGGEAMARQWGAGQRELIGQDFGQQLKDANRQGDAALAAGGFNSPTFRANQYGANARTIGFNKNRALADLADRQLTQQEGARTQTLNMAGARESGLTGLQQSVLGQNIGLRQAPINTELGMMTSPLMNPSSNFQGFTPQSGGGEGLSNLGGGLAAYGSYTLGQNNQADLLKQLLAANGGGSGGGGIGGWGSPR